MGHCMHHQRYSGKCPDCRDVAEGEYTAQLERDKAGLLEALKQATAALAVIGNGSPPHGTDSHVESGKFAREAFRKGRAAIEAVS